MAMRLQEVHPSLVHYPLAFHPLAVVSDALGYLTGSRRLMQAGRWAGLLAAASAAAAGTAGLIAQEEVTAEGEARDLLVTHRTINMTATLTIALLAAWRWRRRAPTPASLAIGAVGLGAMAYSAYLGGKMVYEHGVGVLPALGVKPGRGKELRPGELAEAAADAAAEIPAGVKHAAADAARGDFVPHVTNGRERDREPGDEVGY
ncbi:MAG TPA: DUF2231 domain-containing protein [Gemmatimonadales bacterium]|nr:DUF2231 domain-containing protein [Gemmatimonadales bacterium]